METTQSTVCAACGIPASTRCTGCIEGVDQHGDPISTCYCSKICQTKHWDSHKSACKIAKKRKQLYRAGSALQQLFYNHREMSYDVLWARVEKNGLKLEAYEDQYADDQLLARFPNELLANVEDRNAMLVWLACTEVLGTMYQVTLNMLRGTYSCIGEVTFRVRATRPVRVVYHGSNGTLNPTEYKHMVYRVWLKDDMSYAIDLSGAQYGLSRTVTPWSEYEAEMVSYITDISSPGTYADSVTKDVEKLFARIDEARKVAVEQKTNTFAGPTAKEELLAAQQWISKSFNDAFVSWDTDGKPHKVLNMLRAWEGQYMRETTELMTSVGGEVRAYIEFMAASGGVVGMRFKDMLSMFQKEYRALLKTATSK